MIELTDLTNFEAHAQHLRNAIDEADLRGDFETVRRLVDELSRQNSLISLIQWANECAARERLDDLGGRLAFGCFCLSLLSIPAAIWFVLTL